MPSSVPEIQWLLTDVRVNVKTCLLEPALVPARVNGESLLSGRYCFHFLCKSSAGRRVSSPPPPSSSLLSDRG